MSDVTALTTSFGAPAFSNEATRVSARRLGAHVVDMLLFALLFVAGAIALAFVPGGAVLNVLSAVYVFGGATVGFVAFMVWLHGDDGRTPGKRFFKLRVVDATGSAPTSGALIRRSVPLALSYVYVLALVGMLSSTYRQRFGDRWGRTYVIRDTPAS